MSLDGNTDPAAAREAARRPDGRFGAQRHADTAGGRDALRSTPAAAPSLIRSEFVAGLSQRERLVVHNALLAQVDDNHSGGVMGWGAEEHEIAADLFDRLEGVAVQTPETRAVLLSLVYPVHDMDHPTMSDDEWGAAEDALSELAKEFGR